MENNKIMNNWVLRMQQDIIFAREAYLYTSPNMNLCNQG